MRVLLVCHRYPPFGVAGVERLSEQTATTLTARGHKVTVLTRRPGAAPPTLALEREKRADVPVVSIVGGGGGALDQFPGLGPSLESIFGRLLAEIAPDVVLATHLMHHSPGYVAIAQRRGIPVVLELHDFFAMCPRAHLQRRSGELCGGPEGGSACAEHCFQEQPDAELRWRLRSQSFADAVCRADGVLAPSRFVADAFEARRGSSSIQVVDNAVIPLGPVLRSEPETPAPLHLASIGVTVEHKGFHIVIEALRRAALPAARYTIFGLALHPQAGELYEAAEEVPGLELRLFGGFLPRHLPALLADVDALVVPSLVPETFSIVAREAFACGLPVIASRIGALPDAIRPGENGWLFAPGGASELGELLQSLDRDRRLLRQAATSIRAGDVTSVASRTDRLEALLEEAIAAAGRDRSDGGAETTPLLVAGAASDATAR